MRKKLASIRTGLKIFAGASPKQCQLDRAPYFMQSALFSYRKRTVLCDPGHLEGKATNIFNSFFSRLPGSCNLSGKASVFYTKPYPAMFHHTFTFFWRNALRHKGSFLINLIGLSIGLSVCLWIYLWAHDELAMDRIHATDSHLYQVMRILPHAEGDVEIFENNSDLLAPALIAEMPEIEKIVPYSDFEVKAIFSNQEKKFKASGHFAGPDFFEIFSYPLVEGAPRMVLRDKYSIVISEALALKLFGTTTGLIGKQLALDENRYGGTYTVSGVFVQSQYNSEPFDFIGTYEMYRSLNSMDTHWDSNTVLTYLTLREGTDADAFDRKIKNFVRDKFEAQYGKENLHWIARLFIRPFSDRYLYNTYVNGVQSGGRIDYVILFSIIGVFVLLIACINFTNMATARATTRMKEIGIKKTVGADRRTIAFQYLGESLLTAALASLCSLGLVYLLLPKFNAIAGKQLVLTFDAPTLSGVLAITVLAGLLAGSYPALYLSALRPVEILKGKLATVFGEVVVRRGLVVFQFCISMLLILAVLIVNRQIEFIKTKNLGYNRNQIITFEAEGALLENMHSLLSEIRNIPGVVYASNMSGNLKGDHSGGGGVNWEGKEHRIEFAALYVNYDLIETLGLTLSEGRAFSPAFADTAKVIFNETAIRQMNLKDPIGRRVTLWGQEAEIIGVVKDFHFESLYDEVKPFMFRLSPNGENVMIKVQGGKESEVIEATQKVYAQLNPGIALSYTFLDDDYATLYAAEQRVGDLSSYFAGVAILIATLGLVGLVSFATERRRKEIGVRKVLGASVMGVVMLLCWDFLKLVIIAAVVALPIGYLGAQKWLNAFAFKMDLHWWYFALAFAGSLLFAWLITTSLALKAASANPVKSLQSE